MLLLALGLDFFVLHLVICLALARSSGNLGWRESGGKWMNRQRVSREVGS